MNWIAFVSILSGNLLVGNKKRFGFVMIAAGSLIWLNIGLQIGDYALVLVNASGTIIMARNWHKWGLENAYWNSMLLPQYRVKWWQVWR